MRTRMAQIQNGLYFWALLIVLSMVADPLKAASPFNDPVFGSHQTSNIQYGTGPINNGATSFSLTLDMVQPTNIGVPVPAISPGIVLIHGGSFTSGSKSDLDGLAATYATYGYNVVSINYRLYGQLPPSSSPGPADALQPPPPGYQTFPDPQLGANAINAAVQDAQKAYNIDPNRVAIGGVSAGAITALLEAYNSPPAHVAANAVIDYLGSMYGTQGVIQPGAPPAFVVHGTADPIVPYQGDVDLVNQLSAVGVYNEFYPEPGLGHTINFNQINNGHTLTQNNMIFLANHLLVPEPSSLVLAGFALLALLHAVRRRVA